MTLRSAALRPATLTRVGLFAIVCRSGLAAECGASVYSDSRFAADALRAAPNADEAWTALQASGLMSDPGPSPAAAATTRRARLEIHEARLQRLRELGLAFYERFPADPRRWSAVARMIQEPPSFVSRIGDRIEEDPSDYAVDAAAASAWRRKLAELGAAMAAATDLSPEAREELDRQELVQRLRPAPAKGESGEKSAGDMGAAVAALAEFAKKHPQSFAPLNLADVAVRAARPERVGEFAALWRQLADVPHPRLADLARRRAEFFDRMALPVELALPALDGGVVRLADLRGKVVLVDFWATWCVPCLRQMPELKRLYAKYRESGFEIVGVACEQARLRGPHRTPAEVSAFAREQGLAWLQTWDERKGEGMPLMREFGITGIPALFLFDRDGRLVPGHFEGEELERQISRALANRR